MSLVRCGVCSHAQRDEIEAAVACEGADLVELAVKYRVSAGMLRRHGSHPRAPAKKPSKKRSRAASPARAAGRRPSVARTSPAPEVLEEDEAPATSRSQDLVSARARSARERLEKVLDRIEGILDELDGDDEVKGTAKLAVLRSLVSPIRLLGHFTGEVGASETTVAASPFYRRVRSAIVEALRPKEHRAALDAVIAALKQLEGVQPDRAEAAE